MRYPPSLTADFDFAFQPSIDRKQTQELATLRFIAHGEYIIFLGPPGVGKTHLTVALGMEAAAHAANVYFVTIPELLDQLSPDVQENDSPTGSARCVTSPC